LLRASFACALIGAELDPDRLSMFFVFVSLHSPTTAVTRQRSNVILWAPWIVGAAIPFVES
jgi:hypothetical protein